MYTGYHLCNECTLNTNSKYTNSRFSNAHPENHPHMNCYGGDKVFTTVCVVC